jgi:hypothetical protein
MHSDVRVKLIKTIPRRPIDLIYQVPCTSINHIDPGQGVLPRATLAPGALDSLATDLDGERSRPWPRSVEGSGSWIPSIQRNPGETRPKQAGPGGSGPEAGNLVQVRWAAGAGGLLAQPAGPCAPASLLSLFSFVFFLYLLVVVCLDELQN